MPEVTQPVSLRFLICKMGLIGFTPIRVVTRIK